MIQDLLKYQEVDANLKKIENELANTGYSEIPDTYIDEYK